MTPDTWHEGLSCRSSGFAAEPSVDVRGRPSVFVPVSRGLSPTRLGLAASRAVDPWCPMIVRPSCRRPKEPLCHTALAMSLVVMSDMPKGLRQALRGSTDTAE